ncbi:hypothetical protein [Anaeromicropila herbilytica]|uniref:Uncharacterized protein n=1 Tax=Anaeromicropila herbilytica TaxID=2785025 RepID=A0A7R7IEU2_9FIRM|nr:hypothetical protein [Anaeromicropila herbilytica]BCN32391.1 hypothetical protein bsdtb5_36860 [Anaeromicropila herbilytica]
MKNEIRYELPMFSSNLIKEPYIRFENMDIKIDIEGYDDEDNLNKITIAISSVLCFKQTSARFTPRLYDSYDRIVELIDSEWLKELKQINEGDFNYWKPKHYILYLDGIGMYQFIGQRFEVVNNG